MTADESWTRRGWIEGDRREVSVVQGLMWQQWLAWRSVVMGGLVVWLIGGWVTVIFNHPGWILAFGTLYAFVMGTVFGGGDVAEGAEEFALALPPTREQRFLARLLMGGAPVLVLTALGSVAVAFSLPPRLWGLVVESGFADPFGPWQCGPLYALAVAIPVAVFACTFAVATVSRRRGMVSVSWLIGGAVVGVLMAVCLTCERWLWRVVNGYLSVPILVAASLIALAGAYALYLRKEGISRPRPYGRGGPSWSWLAVIVVVLVLLLLFLMWTAVAVRHVAQEGREDAAATRAATKQAYRRAAQVKADEGENVDAPAQQVAGENPLNGKEQ